MTLQAFQLSGPAHISTQARDRLFAAACFACFALQLWLIWAHVPWLDELQAYLLARDTHALVEWWSNFRYEGHAPLWHLLIKLCMALIDGPGSLKLAQTLCAGSIFALIVWRCPWPWWGRLLLCSNYFLFFEYGVIARDYSLGVALCFAAVAFRTQWLSWALIALIPQAGMQFEMIAGLLVLMQWVDRRRSIGGVLLAGAGMVVAFVLMRPNADFQALGGLITQDDVWTSFLVTLRYAGTALIPVDPFGRTLGWLELESVTLFLSLAAAALIAPCLAGLASRRMPVFSWGVPLFSLATYGLSIFAYSLFTRHFGLVVVVLIIGLWRHPARLPANVPALAWLALLSLGGMLTLLHGAWTPFSAAPAVAARLQQADLAKRPIIPVDTMLGVEPAAYLGVPTVNMTNQCWQTFVRWKGPVFFAPFAPSDEVSPEAKRQRAAEAMDAIERTAARLGGEAVVILDRKAQKLLAPVMTENMHLVSEFSDGLGAVHQRKIYLLRTSVSVERADLPTCGS